MSAWSVYVVRTRAGTLYTGISTDVTRRFGEHQHAGRTSARYLRGKGPLALVYQATIGDRAAALKVEAALKKLPKTAKEEIVKSLPNGRVLCTLLGIEIAV